MNTTPQCAVPLRQRMTAIERHLREIAADPLYGNYSRSELRSALDLLTEAQREIARLKRESVRKDIASISECFAGVDPDDFMQTMKDLRSDD